MIDGLFLIRYLCRMKTKLKKTIWTAACLLAAAALHAQAPTFQWAKQTGGTDDDGGISIATDASGNIYTMGAFSGTADLDPGPGVTNVTASGFSDAFILKTDPAGNMLWVKTLGGDDYTTAMSMAVDGAGNVTLAGYYQGTADFDPGPGVHAATTMGGADVFLLRLDASGNFGWVKYMGGASTEIANAVTLDAAGNIYTTGFFQGDGNYDPGSGTHTLIHTGFSDIFISKLDASGNFLWAKAIGGIDFEEGKSIAVDNAGNVIVGGYFGSPAMDFNPSPTATYTLTADMYDAFITKLDASGNFMWARSFGANDVDILLSLGTDASGNIYSTGNFVNAVDFDPGSGTDILTSVSPNYTNAFILKLNAAGNHVWARQIGGSGSMVNALSLALDASANVYTTGYYSATSDFDPSSSGVYNQTAVGDNDVYVSKLDATGNYIWAQTVGGSSYETGNSIAVNTLGDILVTGQFEGSGNFNPSGGTAILSSAGNDDTFILKLSECSGTPAAPVNTTPSANQRGCAGRPVVLTATSAGSVRWYASPTSTVVLGAGTSYTSAVLSVGNYTYYAESQTGCAVSASRTAVTVTVNALPVVAINGMGMVCRGMSAILTGSGASTYTWSTSETTASVVVTPTLQTTYTVTGTNANGCSNSAVKTLTVVLPPTVSVNANKTSLCAGQAANITASGASTYSWSSSQTTASISVSPTVTTSYTVTGTNAAGCSNTAVMTITVSTCTGVDTYAGILSDVSVYPNPTHGLLNIYMTVYSNDNVIEVYNSQGALVLKQVVENDNTVLSLDGQAAGVYLLKITKNGDLQSIKRIVKY